jgi:exodeoxyribonuclease VII small subunit
VTDTGDTPDAAAEQPDRPIADLTFDDALAELQAVVADLEAGGQPLERSIALYERGVGLHAHCARLLGDAELRLQQLVARSGGVLEAADVGAVPDEPGPA